MYVNVWASDVALAATLTQEQGGKEVSISCATHMMSSTKRHYSAVEQESLGYPWAVEKLEKYLLGRRLKTSKRMIGKCGRSA